MAERKFIGFVCSNSCYDGAAFPSKAINKVAKHVNAKCL